MRLKLVESGKANASEITFLEEYVMKHGSIRARFGFTKQVDYIVQVARARTFSKCPNLFTEHFFIGIRSDDSIPIEGITVGMEDLG